MADLNSPSDPNPQTPTPTPEKPFSLTQFIPQSAIDAAKNAVASAEKGVAAIATQATPKKPETIAAIHTAKEILETFGRDPQVQNIMERTHQDIITRAQIDIDPEKTRNDLIAGLKELKSLCETGKSQGIEDPKIIADWIAKLESLKTGENPLSIPRLAESLSDLFRSAV